MKKLLLGLVGVIIWMTGHAQIGNASMSQITHETLVMDSCFTHSIVNHMPLRYPSMQNVDEDPYTDMDFGSHIIDGINYKLFRRLSSIGVNYWAEVQPLSGDPFEDPHYAGDIYVPDYVDYEGMHFKVWDVDYWCFNECLELKSLSVGKGEIGLQSCPQITNVEIRQGACKWGSLYACDALEKIIFPSSLTDFTFWPQNCKALKEIHFQSPRQITTKIMDGDNWSQESMPSLTDVYFASDYPPLASNFYGEMVVNPNVTIHIPQGSLPAYQLSMWKDWHFKEDQPAIPMSVRWDYCGNDLDIFYGLHLGTDGYVDCAIRVPASYIEPYIGCRISKIEFHAFREAYNDNYWENADYVFITKPGTDYLVKQSVPTITRGAWNEVSLSEPYVITGDELFVGIGRADNISMWWPNYKRGAKEPCSYSRAIRPGYVGNWKEESCSFEEAAANLSWAIRFYIEGDNMPSDVLIDQIGFVGEEENPVPGSNRKEKTAAITQAILEESADGQMKIQATVHSRTPDPIRKLTINWEIDDKYEGSQTFDTNLLVNHEDNFLIVLPSTIQGRHHRSTVDVTEIDGKPDEIRKNSRDEIDFAIPSKIHYPRCVVMEEGTGTWCGWCPWAIETTRLIKMRYPQNFIAIAIHEGDEMYPNNGTYDAVLHMFDRYGIPNSYINRSYVDGLPYYSIWETTIGEMKDMADAIIEADAHYLTSDSSSVIVSSTTTFGYDDDGSTEYRIAYVVLEDSVGPYIQANFLSGMDDALAVEGSPDEYMNVWILRPESIEMSHDDVARIILPSWQGLKGSVPAVIKAEHPYSYDYQLSLPDNIQDKHNIRIVALLVDGTTGEILNACQTPIGAPTGIQTIQSDGTAFNIYTLGGLLVRKDSTTLEGLASGMYIIHSKGSADRKIQIKNK